MSKLNGKLVESARDGAGKIQDVLGTKMYDFVADKFDKMGLSFLNNVAKMATSAASAKLMETLLGGDFMSGKNGADWAAGSVRQARGYPACLEAAPAPARVRPPEWRRHFQSP